MNDNTGTPFARIDVQKLQENIKHLAQKFSRGNIKLRPHVKTHKCLEIAQLQISAGACGITVATLAEAEAMAAGGINDIFLAYPIVGKTAAERSAALTGIRLTTAFDSIFHLEELKKYARVGQRFRVRLEINSGQNRCGIFPEPSELGKIADYLQAHAEIFYLDGVFTHAGQVYRCSNEEEIRQIARLEEESVVKAAVYLREKGLSCPVVSTGTTPTAYFTQNELINECRPGNYVFFDAIQIANSTAKAQNCALTIVSTIIGRYSDHLVIDAGSKALGLDKGAHGLSLVNGYGLIEGYPSLCISSLSEEHGIVTFSSDQDLPSPGQQLSIIPNHSCAAANMFSCYQVFNGEQKQSSWLIRGRR